MKQHHNNQPLPRPASGLHLPAEVLESLALGIGLADDVAESQAHLSACADCANHLARLQAENGVVRANLVAHVRAARPSRRRDWAEISGRVIPPRGGWRRLAFRLAAGGIGGVALTVVLSVGLTAATLAVVNSPQVRGAIHAMMPGEPTPTTTPTPSPTARSIVPPTLPGRTVGAPRVDSTPATGEAVPSSGRREREDALSGSAQPPPAPTLAPAAAAASQSAASLVAIQTPTATGPAPYVGRGTVESDRGRGPGDRGTREPGPPGGRGPGPEPSHEPPRDPDPRLTPGVPPPTPDEPPPGGGGGHPPKPGPGPGPRGPRPAPSSTPDASATPPGLNGATPTASRGGLGSGTAVVP